MEECILFPEQSVMNILEPDRPVVTVSRTHSLREPSRTQQMIDQSSIENSVLMKTKRSFSNEKISTDNVTNISNHQRGSSLRLTGKSSLQTSPVSNNHHSFQIIKTIDPSSPRTSEPTFDMENLALKSQRLKLKSRSHATTSGGPLIPDHNLIKDSTTIDSKTFTPRPPLPKRFSSDQEDANSDVDSNQPTKNCRVYSYSYQKSAPKPPKSPTRGILSNSKTGTNNNSVGAAFDKNEKSQENGDCESCTEDEIQPSDSENHCQIPIEFAITKGTSQRSSLRKNSDSSNLLDYNGRNSPSPTKSVKWNPCTEVKNIPRSRSLNGKHRSKARSHKADIDSNNSNNSNKPVELTSGSSEKNVNKIIEKHEAYVGLCTREIRLQMEQLEGIRKEKYSLQQYMKNVLQSIEYQKTLVHEFENILSNYLNSSDRQPLEHNRDH